MKTKIYYAVGYAMDDYGSGLVVTDDRKSVSVYEVQNNELKEVIELELLQDQNTQQEIKDYFEDNGIIDENESFEMIYELQCLTP